MDQSDPAALMGDWTGLLWKQSALLGCQHEQNILPPCTGYLVRDAFPMAQTLEGCKVNATHSNGLAAANNQPAKTNTLNTNDLDFPTTERKGKATATVIAQLALHGHAVHALMCGDFLVCKYGMSYYAQDLESLQAFAKKLGVCND